jgi:predicted AlkP superfamily pyrophosphatase or phosphodiesterase
MGKRNYPKHRKTRDVSYSKSYKLLQAYGEEELKALFRKHGMYTSSKIISEELAQEFSPYVIRHCRKRYNLGGKNEKVAA